MCHHSCSLSQCDEPCQSPFQTQEPTPTLPSITPSVLFFTSQIPRKHTNCFRIVLVLVFSEGIFVVLFQILKKFPRALWGSPFTALLHTANLFQGQHTKEQFILNPQLALQKQRPACCKEHNPFSLTLGHLPHSKNASPFRAEPEPLPWSADNPFTLAIPQQPCGSGVQQEIINPHSFPPHPRSTLSTPPLGYH